MKIQAAVNIKGLRNNRGLETRGCMSYLILSILNFHISLFSIVFSVVIRVGCQLF